MKFQIIFLVYWVVLFDAIFICDGTTFDILRHLHPKVYCFIRNENTKYDMLTVRMNICLKFVTSYIRKIDKNKYNVKVTIFFIKSVVLVK